MTNRQKQNLLQYLGYYEGRPDGIWGDLSRRATEAFQSDYLPPASVDGIFGPITEARILEVIASGEHPQTQAPAADPEDGDSETGTFWDHIQYFNREEFRCQCYKQVAQYGGPYCDGFPVEPDETLLLVLDEIRRRAGVPISIVDAGGSGVRCEQHNVHVGGVANSEHKYGRAADLHPKGMTPAELYAIAVEVCAEMIPGRGGIGLYDWGVHVDVGKYSRWNG